MLKLLDKELDAARVQIFGWEVRNMNYSDGCRGTMLLTLTQSDGRVRTDTSFVPAVTLCELQNALREGEDAGE